MDTNTTRRNLLRIGTTAVAYAAGAAIVTGGAAVVTQAKGTAMPAPNRAAWDRAFAAMLAATADDDAINARYDAADEAERDSLADEWERTGGALYEATWVLIRMPAPDHAALLWKTEYLFGDAVDNEDGSPSWAAHVIAPYMADARRLLASEGR